MKSIVYRDDKGRANLCYHHWQHSHRLLTFTISRQMKFRYVKIAYNRAWCVGPFTFCICDLTKP